jgi:tripartite-type tricarboxylate transporter receptor subunit TctC
MDTPMQHPTAAPLKTRRGVLMAAATLALAASGAAQAQGFPTRSIKFIVPYAAGGLPDTVARIVGQRLQEVMGQPVVVENRPGGNGSVAAAALASAPADGHTLLVTDGSMLTINPLLSNKLGYDAERDFVPVSQIAQSPLFLAVNANVKAGNLAELIALAKSRPGALNYGSSGIGSSHHLTAEALKAGYGVFITHIPFRGSAASVPAMIGGQVDMVFAAYPSLAGFVKTGQARILASNAPKRSALAPEVPAIAETLPGFDFAVSVVMMGARGTPPDVVARLNTEVDRIVRRPDVISALQVAGIDPVGGTPEQLSAALKAEVLRVTAAAKRANLKAE